MTTTASQKSEPPAGGAQHDALATVLRPLVGFVANVTVLTALLVYFGWERSETQARRLGIDQSVLGMSTQDYVLRSVGPIFWLLVVVGAVGLGAVLVEPFVSTFVRDRSTDAGHEPAARAVILTLGTGLASLPVLVWLLGFVWPRLAFILWPATFGAGVALFLYALHLHGTQAVPGPNEPENHTAQRRRALVRGFGGLLVVLSVFWMASRYAQVLGVRLADDVIERIGRRPEVVLTSQERLHLEGPGVLETTLDNGPDADADDAQLYRYRGLRLLEHTGGQLFLVSEGWTPSYGVVFVFGDDDPGLRFDFVRDRRPSPDISR